MGNTTEQLIELLKASKLTIIKPEDQLRAMKNKKRYGLLQKALTPWAHYDNAID